MDKRCARCGALKPSGEYYKNRGWRDGLHPYCKPCLNAYNSARRYAQRDRERPERRQWSRRFIKHDYFDRIDEPIKGCLLGLLAADGNILDRFNRVTLELAEKDVELVELFRDEVAPTVRIRWRPPRNGRGRHAILAIASEQLVAGLAQWGVVARKTWSYDWPSSLPDTMKRPYLLGHFDGDGFTTISRSSGTYKYGRWGILGTPAFVHGVRAYLAEELGLRDRAIQPKGVIATYYVTGSDALRIDRWLHAELPFGLRRKRLADRLAAA